MTSTTPTKPHNGAPATGTAPTSTPSKPSFTLPKFSASTELILARLRGEISGSSPFPSTSLFSATAATPALTAAITSTPVYADVRRSVLEGMKTSYNTVPEKVEKKNRGGGRVARGLGGPKKNGGAGKENTPLSSATSTPAPPSRPYVPASVGTPVSAFPGSTPAPTSTTRKSVSKPKSSKPPKKKRKGKKSTTDDEESSSLSDLSDTSDEISTPVAPAITLSGRRVLKPQTYVPPPDVPSTKSRATGKRKAGPSGKKEEEPGSRCKVCTRSVSPKGNEIVLCDGCNGGWHQMCHDPPVPASLLADPDLPWFCQGCTDKKNGVKPKPKKSATPMGGSRAGSVTAGTPIAGAPSYTNGTYFAHKPSPMSLSFPHAGEGHTVDALLQQDPTERRKRLESLPQEEVLQISMLALARLGDLQNAMARLEAGEASRQLRDEYTEAQALVDVAAPAETPTVRKAVKVLADGTRVSAGSAPGQKGQGRAEQLVKDAVKALWRRIGLDESALAQQSSRDTSEQMVRRIVKLTVDQMRARGEGAEVAAEEREALLVSKAVGEVTKDGGHVDRLSTRLGPMLMQSSSMLADGAKTVFLKSVADAARAPTLVDAEVAKLEQAVTQIRPPVQVEVDERQEEPYTRETTPGSPRYVRPGNGLMARLKPDEEDGEWLDGGEAEDEAFSHLVFE